MDGWWGENGQPKKNFKKKLKKTDAVLDETGPNKERE